MSDLDIRFPDKSCFDWQDCWGLRALRIRLLEPSDWLCLPQESVQRALPAGANAAVNTLSLLPARIIAR